MPEPITGPIIYLEEKVTVEPSLLRGGMDRVSVWVCQACGSVVFDMPKHDEWHRS